MNDQSAGEPLPGAGPATNTTPETSPPSRNGHRGLRWPVRWPRRDVFTGSGFESQRYLTKWLLLGSIIGVVAGLGAVLFYLAIQWATHFFLGQIVGYEPP